MKHLILVVATIGFLVAAVAFSRQKSADVKEGPQSALLIQSENRNPWTHLRLNNDPQEFQFVIVSDRTGGHREKIFSKAVEQINLIQPEFVLSVGDLIEGYTTDKDKIHEQWKEFQNFTARLQMPFFYVVGNHDITNTTMERIWQEKFGRRYYHFIYRDVLFLLLNTEDPPGSSAISPRQIEFVKKVLEENNKVRWTVVALHKPIWRDGDIEKNGWGEVEKLLLGRNYTVYAGHVHRYQHTVRQGMHYYQLATTGGGSNLRGVKYGEFDHIVWVTMKKNGPVMANIMLDGIYPDNLQVPETIEPVTVYDRKQTHPVKGFAYCDGIPATGAAVSFYLKVPNSKTLRFAGDARVEGDGSFVISSGGSFNGLPVGDYVVTVTNDDRFSLDGRKPILSIPEKYTKAATSDLTATVKSGTNEFVFELKK
jgi:Calcineurin-like phosphoesterase